MKLRTSSFVAVFIAFAAVIWLTVASPVLNHEEFTLEEKKVLEDCENPDYKTYISCLKRQKRHHHSDPLSDIDHACMETCMKKCEDERPSDCSKRCTYCLRRTKHKHQIITEYETECVSGECKNTNNSKPQDTININNNITVNLGNQTSRDTKVISVPVPILPTITIGFGQQCTWPCFPLQQPILPDCSGCVYPMTRVGCDVRCNTTITNPCVVPPCREGVVVH